jgi:pyruvate formate lyase activating enzyme
VHLEIVNLVVPTLNDCEAMLKSLIQWVLDEVGPDLPLRFTRFHPADSRPHSVSPGSMPAPPARS